MDINKYYEGVEVLTYFQYSIKANGSQKKIFTVIIDETNGNALTRYFYEGDSIIGATRRIITGNSVSSSDFTDLEKITLKQLAAAYNS